MLNSRKFWIGVIGVLILGAIGAFTVAALTFRTSLAQTAPPPTTQAPSNTTPGQYQNTFLNALATRLGIDLAKLKDAITGAYSDTIDQAVKDGRLTQDQANQLKQNLNQGFPFFERGFFFGEKRGFDRGFGFGFHFGMMGDFGPAEFAKALGMNQQDLVTELQAGKTISDVAKEHNVDLAKVKQTVLDDLKANLDQAVTNGRLTQAQETQFLNQAGTMLDQVMTKTWTGGMGHRGGWGNFKSLPGQPQTSPQNPTAPTVPQSTPQSGSGTL